MAGPLSDRELWDRRYASSSHGNAAEPDWLAAHAEHLPRSGAALDVATGTGRVACWLARRGLEVLGIDVSPVGLERARARAAEAGLALETRVVDLESESLPAGPWALISCFYYLQRPLFPALREALAPGGVLVCEFATERNLERHARPPARFLLAEGELEKLVAGLEVCWHEEGWVGDRSLARVVARRV